MKIMAFIVMTIMTLGFYLAANQPETGRLPSDDEVIKTQECNKVTGELFNVEIIRCRICEQVLRYSKRNLRGKVVYEDNYSHHCGHYKYSVRYKGSSILSPYSNVIQWLERWQRRLRVKH